MTEALQQEIRTLKHLFESERDPEGRVFAPLADAFRRAGEIQQAVRLLSAGLARHPGFVPGHVVAAQLYVEQGLTEEAAIAARNALELDHENVNALRSLLRVLEERGEQEAEEVRTRLLTLGADLDGGASAGATTQRRARTQPRPPPLPDPVGMEEEVDPDAETVEIGALRLTDPEPVETASALAEPVDLDLVADDIADVDADVYAEGSSFDPALDLVPEAGAGMGIEETVIDLDALGSLSSDEQFEGGIDLVSRAFESEMDLAVEEPIIDLDSLAPTNDEWSGDVTDLAALAPEPEEPVMDLADLAPEPEEPVMDLADLAPEPEEPVMDLADLAPEPEEPVMDLADLAPEPEEPVMDLADLAPEPEEPVMDLADLAPEPEEPVMDLADLAPEPEEPVMDLADLAPEPEEPVMDLADLAPEPEEPVMDLADLAPEPEEPVMDLADLAPEPEEPVMDLADLAPEPEEPVMDLADLAPEPEEPVMNLADLAPEPEEPVMDLAELAPEEDPSEFAHLSESEMTMMDLLDRAPARDDIIIDMDALKPAAEAEAIPEDSSDDTPEDASEDDGLGEPVYTRTLGELYVKQGAIDEAIDVFRHLSDVNPGDRDIARRLAELESGEVGEGADQEVETLARELAEPGDDTHDVASPFAWAEDADGSAPPEPGPTIGDYFSGLLTWKPGPKS